MDTMLCSRGRTCILATILLVVFTVNVSSQGAPKLNVDAKEKVIKGGELFEFICRAGRPIETCSIKFASGIGFKIRENAEKPDYKYYGAGFQKGDCGIKYNSIKPDQHGNVTCTVGYPDIDVESTGFTNLIVAAPPTSIDLRASNEYKEGEEMRISCTATGARPPPVVTLLLDNNTLATSAKMQETVNFNRVASYKDNGKRLICKVAHAALEEPRMTEKTITVFFKPQPANQFNGPIQKFGFFEGKEGIIGVDVFANPKPRLEWRINGEFPDRTKYLPVENNKIRQNEETGAWVAELLINPVSAEDLEKEFVLTATNQHGYEVYNVKISFAPKPPADETDFGAGSIVAIIVAVLIVFVAIILTLFARTTGRWCFAEKAGRENHSNSEAQFEAEDKTAGNDNPNHHDDEPPNYQVISDTEHKSNGKKADKDTPV